MPVVVVVAVWIMMAREWGVLGWQLALLPKRGALLPQQVTSTEAGVASVAVLPSGGVVWLISCGAVRAPLILVVAIGGRGVVVMVPGLAGSAHVSHTRAYVGVESVSVGETLVFV